MTLDCFNPFLPIKALHCLTINITAADVKSVQALGKHSVPTDDVSSTHASPKSSTYLSVKTIKSQTLGA